MGQAGLVFLNLEDPHMMGLEVLHIAARVADVMQDQVGLNTKALEDQDTMDLGGQPMMVQVAPAILGLADPPTTGLEVRVTLAREVQVRIVRQFASE